VIAALHNGRSLSRRSDLGTAQKLAIGTSDDAALVPPGTALVPASVLVPLVCHPDGMTILLTQRTSHLLHHAGQISFPGGRTEEGDRTPEDAALRESHEEIGLTPDRIDIVGRLDDYVTITGFHVVPVVALLSPPLHLSPDPFEVAEIFEVPLSFVMNPENHQRHSRVTPQGETRWFYALPFQDRYIWGATAAMLVNLYEVLADLWKV
jgi:8-oxo-dGTP pyrophosphatase MutT (NUDIX family)